MPEPPAPIKPPLSHYPAGDRQRGGPCPPGTQRPTVPAIVRGPPAWQAGDKPPARAPQPPHHRPLRETEARIIHDARGGPQHPGPLVSPPGTHPRVLGGLEVGIPEGWEGWEGGWMSESPLHGAPIIRGGVPSIPGPPHPPGIPQTQVWAPLEPTLALCRCWMWGSPGVPSLRERGGCRGWAGAGRPGSPLAPPSGPAGAGRSPPGNGAGRGAEPAGPPLSPTPGRCRPDGTAPTHGAPRGTWGTGTPADPAGMWGAGGGHGSGVSTGLWGAWGTWGPRGVHQGHGVSVGPWQRPWSSWGAHRGQGVSVGPWGTCTDTGILG